MQRNTNTQRDISKSHYIPMICILRGSSKPSLKSLCLLCQDAEFNTYCSLVPQAGIKCVCITVGKQYCLQDHRSQKQEMQLLLKLLKGK